MNEPTVCTFDPAFIPAFVELNRQWIEHYFKIEPMDMKQLEQPYESILAPGGEIFFILENERAIGTCAMVPNAKDSYELAKMAVAPESRGRGLGDILMKVAIAWARAKNAQTITILSNTVLIPAIELYKKHGFETIHLGPHPDYSRCNIEMLLKL